MYAKCKANYDIAWMSRLDSVLNICLWDNDYFIYFSKNYHLYCKASSISFKMKQTVIFFFVCGCEISLELFQAHFIIWKFL